MPPLHQLFTLLINRSLLQNSLPKPSSTQQDSLRIEKKSREKSAGVSVPVAKDRASWLFQVSKLWSSWNGGGLAMMRSTHAARWSLTARQPIIPVQLLGWSPLKIVSYCHSRRAFLRSSTGKGLQVLPQWKPSHTVYICKCHTMCPWQTDPAVGNTFPSMEILPSTFPPVHTQK